MKNLMLAAAICGFAPMTSSAAILMTGSTTVGLDTTTLGSVGVTVTGAEATGIANTTGFQPGLTSVPFAISPGGTFSYDPATFPAAGSFAGSVEHTGTVSLSIDPDGEGGNPALALTVGKFSIRFDAARATGGRSGFYVQDTFTDVAGPILFDLALLGAPAGGTDATGLVATDTQFVLGPVNVLVSPELAGVLGNNALIGADVGDARIDGMSMVPEPTGAMLGLVGLGWLVQRRRRCAGR
jgi:MYXO-CTERM domain-containing protein